MGGLAVARMNRNEAQIAQVKPKGKWPLLLAVPEQSLSTEQARRVLPAQYSRADAVTNVQNSMLLLAAFALGRGDLLASALDDRLHQPYRAPLCPLLPALQKLANTPGVLGAALSGAGPSVLAFLDPRVPEGTTKRKVALHLKQERLPAEVILTTICPQGASLRPGWKNRQQPPRD
jgi:homoserine kinase